MHSLKDVVIWFSDRMPFLETTKLLKNAVRLYDIGFRSFIVAEIFSSDMQNTSKSTHDFSTCGLGSLDRRIK